MWTTLIPRLQGLIPARAGKTATLWRPWPPSTAHPRACGENHRRSARNGVAGGSSPRVRGKQTAEVAQGFDDGLIPARAGKTTWVWHRVCAGRAHPRACGENFRDIGINTGKGGSSPRVRGKRARRLSVGLAGGLIPARAGKTRADAPAGPGAPAHPRACGENALAVDPCLRDAGSSPRVRGKRAAHTRRMDPRRLIPARAGKTPMP